MKDRVRRRTTLGVTKVETHGVRQVGHKCWLIGCVAKLARQPSHKLKQRQGQHTTSLGLSKQTMHVLFSSSSSSRFRALTCCEAAGEVTCVEDAAARAVDESDELWNRLRVIGDVLVSSKWESRIDVDVASEEGSIRANEDSTSRLSSVSVASPSSSEKFHPSCASSSSSSAGGW